MFLVDAIYRLALALWVGGMALFTLVLTPTLFHSQPRDLAGKIVGALFPGYFLWGLGCGAVALICLLILRGRFFIPALVLLVLMLAGTVYQYLGVIPEADALKERIGSFEKTLKESPLRRKFSRLHAISASCNMLVLAGGVLLIAGRAGEKRKQAH